MEYVLYDAKEPKTQLINEIKYIQNYIDLEKLRFQDNVNIQMDLKGDLDDCEVPPLLFLPFIENCFKHGAKGNDNSNVIISFEVEDNLLKFFTKNNISTTTTNEKKHGIGNKNVLRRLELLFADKYTYLSKIENKNYIIELTIQL
jgi:LytS/YehU family sensor histidine kinase